MMNFIYDNVEYTIGVNPKTKGPMLVRVDGLEIPNRKEICREFLRFFGWSEDQFADRITNDLERKIKNILNGQGKVLIIPVSDASSRITSGGVTVTRSPRQKREAREIDSVIVVRMYAGGYLDDNIGHEIINTFKTDNGNHFIYVSPWGTVNKTYAHSKNVLLVRGISADVWEVIGYATNLELLLSNKAFEDGRHREIDVIDSDSQLQLIADRHIRYGDVPINEILSEQKNVVYVTYQAHEYHSVKEDKKLYLVCNPDKAQGENYIYIPNVNFAKTSLHQYMDAISTKDAYERLLNLFNDSQWWDEDLCHKIDNLDAYCQSFNILDVIRRDEDELTFSNWLAYYLANDSAFLEAFSKEVLGIDMVGSKTTVKREYKNIDIWLEDENNIVVIENKIKSGINGVVEERHDFSKSEIKSQLSKYVEIAESEANGRNTKFTLLIPDYGVKDDELSVFKEYERYLPVTRYSKLLEFLNKHSTNLPYYEDYKKAVQKHASPYKKNLYQIMEERLIAKIKSKK